MADRPFYYNDPFEAPRVPEAGIYLVNLHYPGGRVVPTNRLVEVKAAFPTVRLYDSNFLYDLSGKKFDRPKPKPKKSSDKSGPPQSTKAATTTNDSRARTGSRGPSDRGTRWNGDLGADLGDPDRDQHATDCRDGTGLARNGHQTGGAADRSCEDASRSRPTLKLAIC